MKVIDLLEDEQKKTFTAIFKLGRTSRTAAVAEAARLGLL